MRILKLDVRPEVDEQTMIFGYIQAFLLPEDEVTEKFIIFFVSHPFWKKVWISVRNNDSVKSLLRYYYYFALWCENINPGDLNSIDVSVADIKPVSFVVPHRYCKYCMWHPHLQLRRQQQPIRKQADTPPRQGATQVDMLLLCSSPLLWLALVASTFESGAVFVVLQPPAPGPADQRIPLRNRLWSTLSLINLS